jgi:hypothetical protein
MKPAKTLHICSVDKFIPAFIEFVRINFDWEQHSFMLIGSAIEKYPIKLEKNIFRLTNISQLPALSFLMHQADKIILHGLFYSNLVRFLALQPWLLKKCYWVMWGGDLYCHQLRVRGFRSDVNEAIRVFVIKRIGHFVTYIQGDYELAQQWYGAKGEHHNCLMYPSNLYKEYVLPSKQGDAVNIMVGNSADPTNNHAEVFEKLKPYKDQNIQIFCPLSYGLIEYAERMAKLGKELFGDKFTPLLDFMPFEKYLELLGNIDIAVFAHKRQQAMGNLISLLGLGKKVFMRDDITSWTFMNQSGIKVYSFDKLELNCLDEANKKNNIKMVQECFSESKLRNQLEEIFR